MGRSSSCRSRVYALPRSRCSIRGESRGAIRGTRAYRPRCRMHVHYPSRTSRMILTPRCLIAAAALFLVPPATALAQDCAKDAAALEQRLAEADADPAARREEIGRAHV